MFSEGTLFTVVRASKKEKLFISAYSFSLSARYHFKNRIMWLTLPLVSTLPGAPQSLSLPEMRSVQTPVSARREPESNAGTLQRDSV